MVTSRTCRELVLTNILVNSMIKAPASVPQATMLASTHQRFRRGVSCVTPSTSCGTEKSPSRKRVARKQTMMEMIEVIQTRSVSGASQLNSFRP